ncbi:galactose mutarotase-like domain-containing protein [Panaeolus papilionaceus]|nr:galactose mutarotase-like domain-containing protein [Panaeolus papilionaceus]
MSEFSPVRLTLPGPLTPSLVLEVLPYGLTIHKFLVQTDGRTNDIVIGPEDPEGHKTQKYTNSIVGRYANRIPVGTHKLERHGITGELATQANETPEVSLHGGPVGYDAKAWTVLSLEDPPALFSTSELSQVGSLAEGSYAFFRLISPSGDQGYPGKLIVETLIALVPAEHPQNVSGVAALGSAIIVYRAKLDSEGSKAVTPVNLTQHWGFNLDASLREGEDSLSIKKHTLNIKADRIAELGPSALGTGNYIPTSSRPEHAHNAKLIGELFPPSGYDDYYVFEEEARAAIPSRLPLTSFDDKFDYVKDLLRPADDPERGIRPAPLVELSGLGSGLSLAFDSNQHGTMFYSNALSVASKGARKKIHGGSGISGNGDAYPPQTAAFLEFHNPLAAFLYEENKDVEDTLLTSDELYHNYVRVDVKVNRS